MFFARRILKGGRYSPPPVYFHPNWGYHIGPLTIDQFSAENNWQAHNAETYYTWNTGTDDWNQFVSVVDANGDYAAFQPPLSFACIHATANDVNNDSTYNNKKFRLEYDGFSVNIPWEYDTATGRGCLRSTSPTAP